MLETLKDLPPGVTGVRAVGRVSREDYERTFEPLLDEARRESRRLRLLYEVGPEFEGFTPGAAWEDARIGLRDMGRFDGCAVVTDTGWIREATRLAGFLMPCPVRVFASGERDRAVAWLASLPEGPGVAHHIIGDSGVLVVEVTRALRAQDFEALATSADAWIEIHGHLPGIVIHARAFPGWENLAGLLRHVRFVRDHHRKVRRIALAADSALAGLLPPLAAHFVHAEIKRFGYDDLDQAIAWAGAPAGEGPGSPP